MAAISGVAQRAGAAGLSADEARRRLRTDGPNVVPFVAGPPLWARLLHQLTHFFAVMLWIASALALLAGMPQLAVAIVVVVVVNGAFAFLQENRAERAAQALHDLMPRRATVRRDGRRVEVDAADLVVGDIVLAGQGDRICADARLLAGWSLAVDTSQLTGESVAEWPAPGDLLHSGTFVVEGEGETEVVATGRSTRLAEIAALTSGGRRPPTPLARELQRVVRILSLAALGGGGTFFVVASLLGLSARDGFLFAVGVTVALVPEGLLPTVTLSLARAARRMAAHHALVRRLEAVETLGSTTFICTDKTGTLTANRMQVVEAWVPGGRARIAGDGYGPAASVDAPPQLLPALRRLALAGARCGDGRTVEHDGGWVAQGDPMEAAVFAFAQRVGAGVADDEAARPTTQRVPFDPRRRRMSVVLGDELVVKGGPEALFPHVAGSVGAAGAALEDMADRGLRILAVARRPFAHGAVADTEAETDLELLGLMGLEDPPRPEAPGALEACRQAGIRVAMVTGDHPATAAAVARAVGLLDGAGGEVLEGRDLPADDDALGALIDRDGIVLARVSPEDKLRIAQALQRRGHVVAMTGDGVNDGPALHAADIGVAMGRTGTDVAREAADLVLLDDNFATIIQAVAEGRATFANIRRFLTYHLTDNVAELAPFAVWALSGGRFPLAIGVLQVLALDIGTDLTPALALGAEPPSATVLRQPPVQGHLVDAGLLRRAFGVLGLTEAVVEMLVFVAALASVGWWVGEPFPEGHRLATASGAAFTAVVIGQMANAFACRSERRRPGQMGWGGNRLLLWAVATELLALVAFLGVPPLARALDHAWPSVAGGVAALVAAPAVLAVDAVYKTRRRRYRTATPNAKRSLETGRRRV